MRRYITPKMKLPLCPCGARDWIFTEYELSAVRRIVLSARRQGPWAATTLVVGDIEDSEYVDTQNTEIICRDCGHILPAGHGWEDVDYDY